MWGERTASDNKQIVLLDESWKMRFLWVIFLYQAVEKLQHQVFNLICHAWGCVSCNVTYCTLTDFSVDAEMICCAWWDFQMSCLPYLSGAKNKNTFTSRPSVAVTHLQVAQGAEARWDFFQPVVVQVDLTDVRDAVQASIFNKLDLVKTQTQSAKTANHC